MSDTPSGPPPDTRPLIVGVRHHPLRDVYRGLLRARWSVIVAAITSVFVLINLVFAAAYVWTGGIENAAPGSFADAFDFSVQTLATIGYGSMHPTSRVANVLVIAESILGVLYTAIATGMVFTKFAVSRARIVFSRAAVITPFDGVPTLMFRIGNDRGDSVLDAQVKVVFTFTSVTAEGQTFYRLLDLPLVRSEAPVLARSFNIMHAIDDDSPFAGLTAEDLAEKEVELMVAVSGIDETTRMLVHSVYTYTDTEILFGHRLADVLSEREDGRLVLDVRKFHEVVAT